LAEEIKNLQILDFLHLTPWQAAAVLLAAVIIGIAKTGLSAVSLLAVTIMASTLGSKESTGIILTMLIIGDVLAVRAYSRDASWDDIKKLLPATLIGLVIGTFVGNWVNDQQFKYLIAVIVVVSLVFMVYQEIKGTQIKVPQYWWFFAIIGIFAGFSTMIGNAAGSIFAVYLLAVNLNKQKFLGTTAWFFLIVNVIKLPMQIAFWHNISWQAALTALISLPAIYFGAWLGVRLVKILPEKTFRYLIIAMTAVAAAFMFFK